MKEIAGSPLPPGRFLCEAERETRQRGRKGGFPAARSSGRVDTLGSEHMIPSLALPPPAQLAAPVDLVATGGYGYM